MVVATLKKRAAPSVDEHQLIASICKDSFYEFVQEFWGEIVPEKPIWNWHIKKLCGVLQKAAERVFRGELKPFDIICNVPPGTTKSTVFSIMFPAWVWTRMPSARFICGSYAFSLAMDLSRKCRDVIRSEKYSKCFPEVIMREDQDAKGYFANTKGGMRVAVGTGASVIGLHAHFIIVDDPIDPQAALSDLELKDVNRWMDETISQRVVEKGVSVMLLVMQRLSKEDPSGWRLKKEGVKIKHICLPAEESDLISPATWRKYYKSGLLDPTRLSFAVLRNQEKILGQYGYAGQYGQSPVPRGGGMFKIDLLQYMDYPPPPNRIKQAVRFWDKAATQGGGAYTVGLKMLEDFEGRIYISHVRREQWNSSDRERAIDHHAELDTKKVLVGLEEEGGSGGKESTQRTQQRLGKKGFRVRVERPHGDKVIRADVFSTQVNSGNVVIIRGPWNQDYVDELQYFPNSVYKDQVDASSGAYSVISKPKFKAGVAFE